jgi:hypothetical protein
VATGIISDSSTINLSKIPGKNEIKEIQKTSILGTANLL